MSYDELQTLQIGERVWLKECRDGMTLTGNVLRGTVIALTRHRNPVTGQENWVGRVTIQDGDGRKHDVLASLVDRMSTLDRMAEAAQ